MGLRTWVVSAMMALAMFAACSTFGDADENDGASDGGTDGTPDDGATVDGPTAADAGSDAWVPCSMRGKPDGAHFCDDFDRQGAIDFGWDNLLRTGNGGGEFAEGISGSPPRAFRARLPANESPPGRAQLELKKASPSSSYRLELDVRIDAIPHTTGTAGFSHFVVIQFDEAPCFTGTNKQRGVELSFYKNGDRTVLLGKGLEPCPEADATAPTVNFEFPVTPSELIDATFRHVSLSIAKGSCPGTQSKMSMYARLDDHASDCIPFGVDAFAESSTVTTYVGAYVGSAAYEQTAYVYDNVTVDLE